MSASIQRAGDVFAAPLDDTLLMMSVENGQYYGLNGVGTRIWELLEQPTTEVAVVERLLAEYEVTPDVCAEQVAGFLAGLRERGLLLDVA
ncbi:PqqD family peptide modification chaperone [Azospirillum sp. sgz301742]